MNLEEKKEVIKQYLRNHPHATCRDVRINTKLRIERIYSGGMKEAYLDASIPFSKPLLKRTKEEMKKQIIQYIRKNKNKATTTSIKKDLRIDIPKVFGKISFAFKAAGVKYTPIERGVEKKKKIIDYIKQNPLASSEEIRINFKVGLFKMFKNMEEIYHLAGIDSIGLKKRGLKKKELVIRYIKKNTKATQWEINKKCKTHVQEIFKGGIIEAYNLAKVKYPIERRLRYGFSNKKIKNRSLMFEKEIIQHLKKVGKVKSQFKTKSGYVDALLEISGKKYVVEIKDFRVKPINEKVVNQICRYMGDLGCNNGIIICNHKNKNLIIRGEKIIKIITKKELLDGSRGICTPDWRVGAAR